MGKLKMRSYELRLRQNDAHRTIRLIVQFNDKLYMHDLSASSEGNLFPRNGYKVNPSCHLGRERWKNEAHRSPTQGKISLFLLLVAPVYFAEYPSVVASPQAGDGVCGLRHRKNLQVQLSVRPASSPGNERALRVAAQILQKRSLHVQYIS